MATGETKQGCSARKAQVHGRLAILAVVLVLGVALTSGRAALAQDANFQAFFFNICQGGGASGDLATRCGETLGGLGNLSGDSESSLNPSQVLSGNDFALYRATERRGDAEERLEYRRDEDDSASTGASGEIISGRLSAYLNGKGEFFDRDRTPGIDQERGYDGETGGFQIGADSWVTDAFIVGAMFGVDIVRSEFDADEPGVAFAPQANDGATDTNSYFIQLYASHAFGEGLYVQGTAGLGYNDYTFDRTVVFQESRRAVPQTNVVTEGDTNGWQYSFSAGAGYDFFVGALSVGPYARVNFSRSEIDGYTEQDLSGSGLAMIIDDDGATSLTSDLGIQAAYAISTNWGVLVPQARFEWEHEFRDDERTIVSRFAGDAAGNVFGVRTDPPDRNYYNLGFSLLGVLPNGLMPFLDYEVLLGYEDFDRHRITGGLRVEF